MSPQITSNISVYILIQIILEWLFSFILQQFKFAFTICSPRYLNYFDQ